MTTNKSSIPTGTIPIPIQPIQIDNRDPCTTWLTLPDGTIVEVDPADLFVNMVENNCTDLIQATEMVNSVLEVLDFPIPDTGGDNAQDSDN